VVLVKFEGAQGKACLASDFEEMGFYIIVPVQTMIDQKLPENVECYNYLVSMITNDARCRREIKSRIVMANAAFNKKKTLFAGKLDLNFGKKLVKCHI
jgi:hypothetical protein